MASFRLRNYECKACDIQVEVFGDVAPMCTDCKVEITDPPLADELITTIKTVAPFNA
jgi:hypothetical protein